MTPIINPWVFYLMDILGNLSSLFIVFNIVSLIAIAIGIFVLIMLCVDDYTDKEEILNFIKTYKKPIRTFIIMLTISIFGSVFIPTKETIIEMTVASCITPANLESAGTTIEHGIDYIIDKVDELLDKDK